MLSPSTTVSSPSSVQSSSARRWGSSGYCQGAIESTGKGSVRDAALIAAAQKVEHYEIASYGTLCTLASQLGLKKAKELLAKTLEEEKKTDGLLTDLATTKINLEAEVK